MDYLFKVAYKSKHNKQLQAQCHAEGHNNMQPAESRTEPLTLQSTDSRLGNWATASILHPKVLTLSKLEDRC